MIVDKQLSVSNRKKADIVVELRKKEFRPFPKVSKAQASGETEEVVEDEEEQGSDSDYDYLLGMPIWSLTKEKVHLCRAWIRVCYLRLRFQIEKLRQQAVDKEADLLTLLERTPIEVWNEDLDRFLMEWEVCLLAVLWNF